MLVPQLADPASLLVVFFEVFNPIFFQFSRLDLVVPKPDSSKENPITTIGADPSRLELCEDVLVLNLIRRSRRGQLRLVRKLPGSSAANTFLLLGFVSFDGAYSTCFRRLPEEIDEVWYCYGEDGIVELDWASVPCRDPVMAIYQRSSGLGVLSAISEDDFDEE